MPHGASAFWAQAPCFVMSCGEEDTPRMVFHIAVCSPDSGLRTAVQRGCIGYFARRADGCIVEQLPGADALLERDAAGARYELILIELEGSPVPAGLAAAEMLRRRGRRGALAFLARTPAHAYAAYQLEAMQYLLTPVREQALYRLLDRAVEPEYGPTLAVNTARRAAAAALWRDRVSGMYPSCGAFPPVQRGGCALAVPAGPVLSGGTAFAGGWPLFAAPPVLCGQPGPGRAGLPR